MKLVLHIGTEKTGTTSFQQWAHINTSTLREEGVWYGQCIDPPNQRAIAVIARDEDKPEDGFFSYGIDSPEKHRAFRKRIKAELRAEVDEAKAAGMRVFLISNEHCQSRLITPEMVQRLATLLVPLFDEVEVICFLRPQIDAAISLASTGARVGQKISRKRFEGIQAGSPYYNYGTLLARWAGAFGRENITPVPFKQNKSTIGYFVSHLGLKSEKYAADRRVNSALDYRAIAFGNRLNLPRFISDNVVNPNRLFYLEDIPFERGLSLSRDFAVEMNERFRPGNEELVKEWPQIGISDLTPDWEKFPETGTIDELDTCDIEPVMQYVVQRFNAELAVERGNSDVLQAKLSQKAGNFKRAIGKTEQALSKFARAALFEPVKWKADKLTKETNELLAELQDGKRKKAVARKTGGTTAKTPEKAKTVGALKVEPSDETAEAPKPRTGLGRLFSR